MKNAGLVLLSVLIASLQTTWLNGVNLFGARADLLLAFVVVISLKYGIIYGGAYGLLCGVLADSLSFSGFGYNSLILMYMGICCGLLKDRFFDSNGGIVMLTAFLCSFIHKLLYFIFSKYIWNNQDFWYVFFTKILLGAIFTAVVAILLYGITVLYNRIKIRKGRSRYYGF
ncbi:MAG: rod shape-determining protein MreD [Clostridia bacterium]|nr:rod shape-determining protein MreD [Clostridia bacterium]